MSVVWNCYFYLGFPCSVFFFLEETEVQKAKKAKNFMEQEQVLLLRNLQETGISCLCLHLIKYRYR